MSGPALPGPPRPASPLGEGRAEGPLFIAPYRDEAPCDTEVVFGADGRVRYADEQPGDRCVDGWLWERWEGTLTGGQLWAEHHPARQRHVMRQPPLCGGCAGAAHRDERGMLWLLHVDDAAAPAFPCDITTVTPPLCLPDARRTLRDCRTRNGFIAVRARTAEIIGVRGTVHSPTRPPQSDTLVLFGDARMKQVVARQMVVRLYDAERDETTLPLLGAGRPR